MSTDTTLENFAEVPPEDACTSYRSCGNRTPGSEEAGNMMCDSCVDSVRDAGPGTDLGVRE